MIVLGALCLSFCWLLRYRVRGRFLRAYGALFLILLVFASNKTEYGIPMSMTEGAFSPLSLARWGLLVLLVYAAFRLPKPARYRPDVMLGALVMMLLTNILLSTFFAADFSYSMLRALSFVLLAVALLMGFAFFLAGRDECREFFLFHYYAAWIVVVPVLLLYVVGLEAYGASIIMGQYAGVFGNQNMYGAFSALITPYVLFHHRVEARTRQARLIDLALIGMILLGVWFSHSRGGLLSTLIVVTTFYFVVHLASRIKIIAASLCAAALITLFPNIKDYAVSFIRKDTARFEIRDLRDQINEEKRFEMWNGVFPLFWREKLTGYGFASSHKTVFPFTTDVDVGRSIHNSYLELFGDLGLPGLLLLLLILARVTAKVPTVVRRGGEPLDRETGAVFIAVLVAGSFNAFFESWMFSVGNLSALMYWVPVAGIAARWAGRRAPARTGSGAPELRPEFGYPGVPAR